MIEILAPLEGLLGPAKALAAQAFLVFLRVGAMMALLPAFGEKSVPMRVRLALTVVFTAVILPAVPPPPPEYSAATAMTVEVVAGLILGVGLRLMVHALQIAGTIAAQSVSLSQLFPSGTEPQPAAAQILGLAGIALAVSAGLHVQVAELLLFSYEVFPAGRMIGAEDLAIWGLDRVTRVMALAFGLAAPFMIGGLLYNLAIGVINRAMPHLMVAFVGAPAMALGGIVLLLAVSPALLAVWLAAFGAHVAQPFAIAP